MATSRVDPPAVLRAYFRRLDDKIAFLHRLYEEGRREEALTLCCVYIEAFGQLLYSTGSKELTSKCAFVKPLLEYGGEELLCMVDPPSLAKSLRGLGKCCGAPCVRLAADIEAHFCSSPVQLRNVDELAAEAEAKLSPDQLVLLKEHAWHGTIAALAYKEFRNPLVHRLHASAGFVFSDTVYRNASVPRVSFATLYPALRRIVDEWKPRFLSTCASTVGA